MNTKHNTEVLYLVQKKQMCSLKSGRIQQACTVLFDVVF